MWIECKMYNCLLVCNIGLLAMAAVWQVCVVSVLAGRQVPGCHHKPTALVTTHRELFS